MVRFHQAKAFKKLFTSLGFSSAQQKAIISPSSKKGKGLGIETKSEKNKKIKIVEPQKAASSEPTKEKTAEVAKEKTTETSQPKVSEIEKITSPKGKKGSVGIELKPEKEKGNAEKVRSKSTGPKEESPNSKMACLKTQMAEKINTKNSNLAEKLGLKKPVEQKVSDKNKKKGIENIR